MNPPNAPTAAQVPPVGQVAPPTQPGQPPADPGAAQPPAPQPPAQPDVGTAGVSPFPTTTPQAPIPTLPTAPLPGQPPAVPPQQPPVQPGQQPPADPNQPPQPPAQPGQQPAPQQPPAPELRPQKDVRDILAEWEANQTGQQPPQQPPAQPGQQPPQQPPESPIPNLPDISKLPADRNGNVDPQTAQQYMIDYGVQIQQDTINKVTQQLTQQFDTRLNDTFQEKEAWARVEKKYPQVVDSPETRQYIRQMHVGAMITNPQNSKLEDVADSVMKPIVDAQASGYTNAKRTQTVVQSQHLTNDLPAQTDDKPYDMDKTLQRMTSGSRSENTAAAQDTLSKMYEAGLLGKKAGGA